MLLVAAGLLVGATPPVGAEGGRTDADALGVIFGIRAALESCDFPATAHDVEAMEAAESRLIAALKWDDERVNAHYTKVESELSARSWDVLCADPAYKTQVLEALRGLSR